MTPQVEKLLDSAAQVTEEARAEFLARECSDPREIVEVAALLQYADDAESYFDRAIRGVAVSLRSGHEPVPGDVIGSYRLVSLIGRGGMGSVYLAERADGEIQQRVAIKLLRADSHRTGWGERFLLERQFLASLNHPSVVHVIDAGHTDDGRPFLVMEYVEGVPIDRYAAGIGVRERLKLMLRVCEGVSHAHQRLIIHRDLKPSNILVDAAGRPKLLDFGIAKLLNVTDDCTQTADRLLTPNYASPEQLNGEAQTTATDVYSLAAVLYKVLTGVAPRENLRGSAKSEASPPSQCNPAVPRDIDFVVNKALRLEPEHRYSSVDEFANDLRAALDRRPVQARGDDLWYRVRRSLRRRWIPLAATALVTAGLATGLWMVNRERAVAERHFTEVRQLASKLFDVDVQVAQLPGASKTRQLIVNTALEYLTKVTADVRMEPALALEVGTAYMRVARVQGINISPNLGLTQQAGETERKAQALIDSVLAAQPHNRGALLRAGQIAHDRMILAGDQHHEQEALQFAHISVERLDQYLRTGALTAASDRLEAQQVILTFINVANRYMLAGHYDQSIETAQRAIGIASATNWPTQAGAALIIVALDHRAAGDLEEALRSIREAVRLLEPSPDEKSTGRLQAYGLALIREGQILGEDDAISLNRPDDAVEAISRALKIGEDFARRDPADFQSQYRIFTCETKLAAILHRSQPARALALYDDAAQRLTLAPANGGTLRNQTVTLADSVDPLLRLGRRAEARKRLNAALDGLKRLGQYPAKQIDLGSPADDTLRALAEYEAYGNPQRGAARYEELLRLVAAANPKPETRLDDAVDLSGLYRAAARLYRQSGDTARAAALEARRQDLWRQWNRSLPNNAFVRRQLQEALQN